ncbi:hypothetical protein D1012_21380 [Pseudotabrizicola alkalilacus]|uniref:Uncharacterized protein n=1 Tax=Pseudotabrizicola alkalilacus TaxID=2305252 RepID=A0A411YWP5_9RHOB|nr:hypothetical protein D1012_21380 [Pseudotabrizicola alkalilacus]
MALDLSLFGIGQAAGTDITAMEEAEPSPSVPLACLLRSRAIGRVLLPSGSALASVDHVDLNLCRAIPDALMISIGQGCLAVGFGRTESDVERLEHVDNLQV